MDSTGKMREAFTNPNRDTQLKHIDKLDESILVDRSLSDIANVTSLDGKNKTMYANKQLCALKHEHGGAMRLVAFHDVIDHGTTVAYSTIYDTLPKRVVATSNGTITMVSYMADHYTGKSAEVMRAHKGPCTTTSQLTSAQKVYFTNFP